MLFYHFLNNTQAGELDDGGSHFFSYASARLAPIVALASTSSANPAFSLLAVVVVSTPGAIQ
jgi:hypothetical protein